MPNEETQPPEEEGKLVGKITHYFGNIGVAVIELSGVLKAGDTIRIVGGATDFTQAVESMELDHKKIETANYLTYVLLLKNILSRSVSVRAYHHL